MANDTLVKTVIFAAPRELVWDFLTKKQLLAKWFFAAEADLAANKEYVLVSNGKDGQVQKQCWGKVTRWNPPAGLAYSFETKFFNGTSTHVSWQLEELQGGTKLTLEHSGLAATGGGIGLIGAFESGWDRHFATLRAGCGEKLAH